MKRGLLTRKRLALSLPLALGAFSVLVFGGTRRLFLFNLQQIVPARAGSTYFSIWHVPKCCFTRDVMTPCWRRWPKEYERRKGDWRIHAARAFLPDEAWATAESADIYDAVEDSLREYEEAIRLAPNQACLFAGKVVVFLTKDARSVYERLKRVNGVYVIDSDWEPPEREQTKAGDLKKALEEAKRLGPDNGFPLLLKARLLFTQGRDDQAVRAVAAAMSKDHTFNYGLVLSRNAREFLRTLGVLGLEARNVVPTEQWPNAAAGVGKMLFAMGRAARTSGDHTGAVRLFALGARAMAAAHEERIASLSALLEISPSEGTERQEDRVAAALVYLRGHGAGELAEHLAEGYEEHKQYLDDSRRAVLTGALGCGAMFGATLLLFQMVLLGLLEGTTLLIKRRGAETELPTEDRFTVHGLSACLMLAAAALGVVGCSYYLMHITYRVPAPEREPLNIVFWSFALVLFFVFANLLLPGGKVKALADFFKGWADIPKRIPARYTMLKEYSIPCVLTYCGYAYVVLVWCAYFLRERAMPLL